MLRFCSLAGALALLGSAIGVGASSADAMDTPAPGIIKLEVEKDQVTCTTWLSEGCCSTCKSTCCSEGDPERQCKGCDESVQCHPGAQCYNLTDPARKFAAFKDVVPTDKSVDVPPGSACQPFCRDTAGIGCCNFSTPYLECGGCDKTNDCNPSASCYREMKPEL